MAFFLFLYVLYNQIYIYYLIWQNMCCKIIFRLLLFQQITVKSAFIQIFCTFNDGISACCGCKCKHLNNNNMKNIHTSLYFSIYQLICKEFIIYSCSSEMDVLVYFLVFAGFAGHDYVMGTGLVWEAAGGDVPRRRPCRFPAPNITRSHITGQHQRQQLVSPDLSIQKSLCQVVKGQTFCQISPDCTWKRILQLSQKTLYAR